MADEKLHLPDDLLSSKTNDEVWGGGTVVEKAIMGSLDDSKDQVTSDSSIPLSPQWLYAKPVDAKIPSVGSSVEMRPPSSLGKSLDNSLKEGWRLDGSQDIKDRRKKTALDIENNRRWREEERDTSLLGRRDRRKEERRADSMLSRDITDSKSTSSSDRWHDSGTRNSVHESRRDSKWSSRWGPPEDKEKDSRTEKRVDVEKEDSQIDKLPFAIGSRTTSDHENESRDKWRPRHRMEVHAGGTAAYRGAPGFGTERGRVEGSNVRFSAGRGRAIKGNIQISGQTSAPAIGSIFLDKNFSYSYPRGKLLDIYRSQKTLPSFDTMPDAMENVINITQKVGIEPLAFVAPDAEEEAALGDTWLGKITSSGGLHNQLGSSDGESNDDIGGLDEATLERNWGSSVESDEIIESVGKVAITDSLCGCPAEMSYVTTAERDAPKDSEHQLKKATTPNLGDSLMPAILKKEGTRIFHEMGRSNNIVEQNGFENRRMPDLAHIEHPEDIESAPSFQIGSQLFDDPGFPSEFTSRHQCKSRNEFSIKSIDEARPLGSLIPPDELSFCYLDPQGVIQGPYLGIDILTWFEQGYFGMDLPVRLSDAPDGSLFHELGEIMPYLKAGSVSTGSKLSDTVGGSLEVSTPDFAINHDSASGVMEDQQWAASRFEAVSGVDSQLRGSNNNFQPEIMYSDGQNLQNFVSLDEEGFPPGRPGSNCSKLLIGHSPENHNLVSDPSSHPSFANELSAESIHTHQDENVHPFGLLMSELTGNSQSMCNHPSNISSSIDGHGQFMEPFSESNTAFPNQSSISGLVDQRHYAETWSDDYCKNSLTNPNIDHQSSKREIDFCDFDLQHQILQNLQKGPMQQHNNFPHTLSNNRLGIEENPSHLFNLQLQQQHQLELQQQQQQRLELQQRQWQLELQQQQQFELQQQKRQLELQQQQRQLELLQQQRKLELLQQQRQLELLQQQRQLDLQQQQRQLELQKQQQLHNHQVKLQQQQQEQLVVEQLLRHQMSDFGYRQQKVGTVMDNIFEQVQFGTQLPELLQSSHPSRHLNPAVEQIIRAKIGLNALQDPQNDYLDMLQANHGNVLHSNQFHAQQEPLQAQQLSWALKQQLGLDGERHLSESWSANESSQLPRNLDLLRQSQSSGFNTPNFYQQQQRLSSMEEHVNHLRWKHALKERLEQGFYEPNSVDYGRSISLPDVASGMMNRVNGHPLHPDSPEQHLSFLPSGRLGSFSSSIPSPGEQFSDNFHGSRPETMGYLSRKDGQLETSSIEDGVQQLHPESHQWSKVSEVAANSDIWTSIGTEEESSKRLLMELHRKLGHHQSIQAEREYQHHIPSSEPQDAFWGINQLHSSPLNHIPDQEVATNLSIMQGQHDSNSNSLFQDKLVSAAVSSQNGSKSDYGAIEERTSLSSTRDAHASYVNARSMTTSKFDRDLEELERKEIFSGSRAMSSSGSSVSPIEDIADQAEATIDFGKLPIKGNGRRGSISSAGGNQGFYSYEKRHNLSSGEEVSSDSAPSILTKGIDNTRHKRPPPTPALASHDGLSELAVVEQKSLMSRPPNVSEKRPESVENVAANSRSETKASSKKEMRFRRTSSYGDATVSETSFIDVLKKPVYSEADVAAAAASESFDGGSQATRSGKKKGKKGRQIDPALLGFKVSSNRIMMGEIYRLQD